MRKITSFILGALALGFVWSSSAQAQSTCPYIATSSVLTPEQWQFCFQNKTDYSGVPGSTVRQRLSTATTFYVNNSVGVNQTGCGLATGSQACNTCSYMVLQIQNFYDLAAQAVTVQLATTGTNYSACQLIGPFVGGDNVTLQGDPTNLDNVIIDGAGGSNCVQDQTYATLNVRYLKLQNCTVMLAALEQFSTLTFNNIDFGAPTASGVGVLCSRLAYCEMNGGGNLITGGVNNWAAFIEASHQGNFRAAEANTGATALKLMGNQTFNTAFAYSTEIGDITFTGYSGTPVNLNTFTATGFTWVVEGGSIIQTGLAGVTYFFPGSASGLLRGDGNFNGNLHSGTAITAGGGASPTFTGVPTDWDGIVVEGSGSTGVTLTFGSAFDTVPVCGVNYLGVATTTTLAVTTTTLITTHDAGAPTFTYSCHGG